MKPKCTICNKELEVKIFEGITTNIYYFECNLDNNHYFDFDFDLINGVYYPRSFYFGILNDFYLIFEIFFNYDGALICKIKDTKNLRLNIDKIILKDISDKFTNNQLTKEYVNSIIDRLKDLALFA